MERSVEEVIRLAEHGSGEGATAIPVEPAVKAAFRLHFSQRMFQARMHASLQICQTVPSSMQTTSTCRQASPSSDALLDEGDTH